LDSTWKSCWTRNTQPSTPACSGIEVPQRSVRLPPRSFQRRPQIQRPLGRSGSSGTARDTGLGRAFTRGLQVDDTAPEGYGDGLGPVGDAELG
jgi:hypothetical protein